MRRAVGLMLGAVILGLLAIWASVPRTPEARPAPPPPAAATTTLAPVRSQAASEAPARPGELAFRRVIADAGRDLPEACLVFSADLDASGAVRYADYLGLPKGAQAGVRVTGARLCLSGLGFGTTWTVTLKQGLPAADGAKLPADTEVQVDFGDRPQRVSFPGGFVLPRDTADGLPVTTVNVDRLALSVYRVGDRLLARMRQDFVDDRTMYAYRLEWMIREDLAPVWSGEMPVSGPRNDAVTSLFPLSAAIAKAEPGAYLVVARIPGADDDERPAATQWVVRSDLGLAALTGADGLTLAARSLASAKPVSGVRLTLIARNNEELAAATTDAAGVAHFDPGLLRGDGGLAPAMAMAYAADGDFNFLDLRRPDFDLSDRGVSGRTPPRGADAFLYADRGIYRPGETVHLAALLRDETAHALTGRTLVLKAIKPDGREYRRFVAADAGGGGATLDLALPTAAPRGGWSVTAHADPEGAAIGRVAFEVQDFVPQRLALDLGEAPARLAPGAAIDLPLAARFLYGAPAAGLTGEGEVAVSPDPAPFPAFSGYRWGRADETFSGVRGDLAVATTDAEGKSRAAGQVPQVARTTLPLRAEIGVAIHEPGGRSTSARIDVPVRPLPLYFGVRPGFDDGVKEGAEATFEVIAVDAAGDPRAAEAEWRIFRDASTWQWYRSGSQWRYERIAREVPVASGRVAIAADAPARIAHAVSWGRYRLEVRDPASGAATSVPFTGGWWGSTSADRPDRLKLAADRQGYAAGETARLRIESDAAGEAQLVIANERVHEVRNLSIPAGGGEISVTMKPEWGAGAYALVTLYRPLADDLGHAPVRAVGVAWLGLDPAARTLGITLGAPERTEPRRAIEVPVEVRGATGAAFVTLAAVDQGILQLTRFATPDPAAHYLGKRRLGVGVRDDYGRLIRGLGAAGDDAGGDAFGGKGLDVVPTRSVALFSGLVALSPEGRARIPLEIPDFQGELRLMAVAFDAARVGAAEARLTVRDPVVAEVILPRFLSPGDRALATVNLHNVSGAPGDYRVRVAASGAVAAAEAGRNVSLAAGVRQDFTVPLEAASGGVGAVRLAVDGPEGFHVERDWPIQVRAAQLPQTVETTAAMAPGETARLDAGLLDGFVPGTAHAAASLSRWPGLDVPGLLRWLDRYPFGCLEQTVSRAMPLLDFNDVALLAGGDADRGIDARVQEAIERVAAMQAESGGFRMWGAWGEEAHPWLSAFAMDFLTRAADKGYDVPAATLDLGRRRLAAIAGDGRPEKAEADARAYAALVLARRGFANPADLRYLADERPPRAPLALAQLGAALDAAGERARAKAAFAAARKGFDAPKAPGQPYGGRLRDTFAAAAALAESGRAAEVPELIARARGFDTRADRTTTQEKVWMLRFAAEIARDGGRLAAEADGHPLAGDPAMLPLPPERLAAGVTLKNAGAGEIFRTVSVEGVPAAILPPVQEGLALFKTVHRADGRPADLAAVRRNDRLVVVVQGEISADRHDTFAVLDLLPAGWEIEAVLRNGQPGYDWLGALAEPRLQEARDDRFVAALDMPWDGLRDTRGRASGDFRLAYVVRAVTPGDFALPAAAAENMYAPAIRARTEMGRLGIAP